MYKTSFAGLTLVTPTGKEFFNKKGAPTQEIEQDLYVTQKTT